MGQLRRRGELGVEVIGGERGADRRREGMVNSDSRLALAQRLPKRIAAV
jgi:hypothetical protein